MGTQAFYRRANKTTNQEIMKSVLLLSAFVLGCYAEVVSWEDKPSFCKDHDCPKYTVVSTNDKYEVRSYEKSYWVTTRMPAKNYWQDKIGSRQAFWRLFGYITGNNDQGMKMAMTAPVLKYHMKDEVVMAFMIPYSMYGKAPEPTDSKVTLFISPAMQVYVKTYSGEGWNPDYVQAAALKQFRSDLSADDVEVTGETFYVAGYDGPSVRHFDRHHEIWIANP